MKLLILIILFGNLIIAQTVYEIPFASEGNEIELEVFNDSEISLDNVAVTSVEKPEWLMFTSDQEVIPELEPNKNGKTLFKFDVDKDANVLEAKVLKFQIAGNNQIWDKEIKITVLPPDKFELNQNYPNPFNPSTTITYTIPVVVSNFSLSPHVNLTVYDILGREVETLVNEEQKPGFYKFEWNANHLSSGMYIYQVSIKGESPKGEVLRRKMMLMK